MKRAVLLFFSVLFSVMYVAAEENVLQTIEIEPVKDTYNIVLVSDKAVDVKKTVQDSNKINLTLKDIRASKTLNTVYNNVANVDTVMVEQQGNGVSIFFQAENAEAATVTFDALTPAPVPVKTPSVNSSLKLNNPIESYAPIYKDEYSNTKTSSLYNRLKSNTAFNGIKETIDDEAPASDLPNKLISLGLIILFVFTGIRLFRKREPERKIGLPQQYMNQENYGTVQPMNDYRNPAMVKPFTTVNYGLNAYRNENKNPYETAPMQIHNPRLRNYAQQIQQPEPVYQQTAVKEKQLTSTTAQTAPKKMTTPVNTAPVNQSNPNVDNLKFL